LVLTIAREPGGQFLDEPVPVEHTGQVVVSGGMLGDVQTRSQFLHLQFQVCNGLCGLFQ